MECLTPAHYGPDGATPLCGEESSDTEVAVLLEMVTRCDTCLELVAEDLADSKEYRAGASTARMRSEARPVESGGRQLVRQPRPRGPLYLRR